ncbi:MAG: FMN-binding protein [Lachnospiraceae bacterium]
MREKLWKKMKAIVSVTHLLPALLVVALVGTMLAQYVPQAIVQAKAEQTEETPAKTTKTKKTAETEAAEEKTDTTEFSIEDLADGEYYGEGVGFAGKIKVKVVIADGKIVSIELVEVEKDDAAYVEKAKGVITAIIASQSLDVDTVSGATYSSNGIIDAVRNALTGAESKSTTAAEAGAANQTAEKLAAVAEPGTYQDGTYYGTGTGYGGAITVKVVISGGKITAITIESAANEDEAYLVKAKAVITSMLSQQTTNVDTVSGATFSSNGIIQAVRNALAQAGATQTEPVAELTPAPTKEPAKTPSNSVSEDATFKDGTYTGSGEGFAGNISIKLVIKKGLITSIVITDVEADDAEYMAKAKAILQSIIKQQSTTKVDVISGATYSSNGIIEAVNNALAKAVTTTSGTTTQPTKKVTPTPTPDATLTLSGSYKDGTYLGEGIGYLPGLNLEIVVAKNRITKITLKETNEDASYLKRAQKVITDILLYQKTTGIDTVSGATRSSEGILEAVRDALKKAEISTATATPTATPTPSATAEPTPTDTTTGPKYTDGTYTQVVECVPDATKGFEAYDMTLTLVIANDQITEIKDIAEVNPPSTSLNKTYITLAVNGYSSKVGVAQQILTKQSTQGIDAVTMATCTSNSIVEAVDMILQSAAATGE